MIFVAKMGKYGIFVAKMGKYGIFVAKFCKYALIDSFQGYAAVIDSSANCAALLSVKRHKMALKRYKMAFKRHNITLKRHNMALKSHKMALKRMNNAHCSSWLGDKSEPWPRQDNCIRRRLCYYYKLLILSEQNNVHTLETMWSTRQFSNIFQVSESASS